MTAVIQYFDDCLNTLGKKMLSKREVNSERLLEPLDDCLILLPDESVAGRAAQLIEENNLKRSVWIWELNNLVL